MSDGHRADVLYVVVDNERWPRTAYEIASDLNYSRQSVRAHLSWLERHGFVTSEQMSDDRGVCWLPTDTGREFIAQEEAAAK
jgi:DNA-binding MarR family transcriptional regulator